MLASDFVICMLSHTMWNEGQPEDGIQGMTACGLVIRNRVLAGWEAGDWIANIRNYRKYEASPVESKTAVIGDPIRDDKFRRCLAIASNIYSGLEKDITFGALRSAKLDQCSEDFANKIVRPKDPLTRLQLHPRVAQIGLRSFFK